MNWRSEVEYHVTTGRAVHVTEHAVLVRFEDGKERWVPLAVCSQDSIDLFDKTDPAFHDVGIAKWWVDKNLT